MLQYLSYTTRSLELYFLLLYVCQPTLLPNKFVFPRLFFTKILGFPLKSRNKVQHYPKMTSNGSPRAVAPQIKKHQQYLAILKLYTEYDTAKICRILNEKFKGSLRRRKWVIDPSETDVLWHRMSDDLSHEHEIVTWARRQRAGGWRVKRVLRYAEWFK